MNTLTRQEQEIFQLHEEIKYHKGVMNQLKKLTPKLVREQITVVKEIIKMLEAELKTKAETYTKTK